MIRKFIIALIGIGLVVVVFLVLGGTKGFQFFTMIKAGKAFTMPPETIASAEAHLETWGESIPAVASVVAAQGVVLTPEVPGTVSQIGFESGAQVNQGDLLVKFDTSTEEAQLRAIEAQVVLWKLNFTRAQELVKNNAMSKSELDAAEATLKQGEADADTIRSTIAKKTIRAPFAGRTGIRMVNLGQYVDKAVPIVSLQSLAPLYAEFSMPQQDLARLQTGLEVRLTTDVYPGKEFIGRLNAMNPNIDSVMRAVQVQAVFENADQLLRPGMFGRVEVVLPAKEQVLAIPGTSVIRNPYGDQVFVVEPSTNAGGGLVVRSQIVKLGRTKGDFVSVVEGLKAGERVVKAGVFKLHNGTAVVENNEQVPKNEKKPNPSDS